MEFVEEITEDRRLVYKLQVSLKNFEDQRSKIM